METPINILMSEHHDDGEGMDRFKLAQQLQEALFAHPQAGPIPVSASLITLVMEELRGLRLTRPEAAFASPEGWKLVPSVPTDEMLIAADDAWGSGSDYQGIYIRMLDTAPMPPSPLMSAEKPDA